MCSAVSSRSQSVSFADLPIDLLVRSEPHLMPLLSDWLRTTEYNGLQTSAGDLLHALLSASPDAQMGNLDITTYVSALGFPNILTCASHTAFVANAASSPHLTRQKLRCCADLLGALLQHQG